MFFKKKKKRKETFTKWMNDNWEKENMLPPVLEPQQAVNFLCDYLLGEDYYFVEPLSVKQGNVEIVSDILYEYSKEYRKEFDRWHKDGFI